MSTPSGFKSLGIAPSILTALDKLKFITPTPIQEQSIPPALAGEDVIGIAQTGTGKTLAFGIPLLQHALQGRDCLIVLPTRELAIQVAEELDKIGRALGVRSAVLIGGESMGRQLAALRRGPQIVIGTPGRIADHLQQKTLTVSNVSALVLDEADRMLDMGFLPQINAILKTVPENRQTLLFSATLPDPIVKIATSYMQTPTRVEVATQGTASESITQELFFVHRNDRLSLLHKLAAEYRGAILVFTRTKHGAKKLALQMRRLGYTGAELHGNRSLAQRKDALEGFRSGKYRVLVATDIAARGIDVRGIELVVNYDLPTVAEDYVHRIGRTGRAEAIGHAISFAAPDQRGEVRGIERILRMPIPTSPLPAGLPSTAAADIEAPGAFGHAQDARKRAYGNAPARRGAPRRDTPAGGGQRGGYAGRGRRGR